MISSAELIWNTSRWPVVGSRWLHVKTGHVYQVTGRALLEKTLSPVVIYERWSAPGLSPCWVRPLDEFMDGRFRLT